MKLKNLKENFKKHSNTEINIRMNNAAIVLLRAKKYNCESTLSIYTKKTKYTSREKPS